MTMFALLFLAAQAAAPATEPPPVVPTDWAAMPPMPWRTAPVGPLVIDPIIYGEVSTRFVRVEDLDDALPAEGFRRDALPWDAAFLAAKAFADYRRRGGIRTSTLPDFLIGAHAAVQAERYRKRECSTKRWIRYQASG